MPDYKVQSLNGLLTEAASCREFVEAVVPLAEPILADLGEVTPRLFFVTQDGEDGLLTPLSEATDERGKDELAYPITDELRDRIAAHLEGIRARDPKPGNVLSFGKGKTAGEVAVETVDGPAPTRIVEKDGYLYFIGLQSGEPNRRAKKSQLLAALGMDKND
jgi:hypothetical protein